MTLSNQSPGYGGNNLPEWETHRFTVQGPDWNPAANRALFLWALCHRPFVNPGGRFELAPLRSAEQIPCWLFSFQYSLSRLVGTIALFLGPADQWLSRLLGGVRAAILLSCETDSPMGRAHGGLYADGSGLVGAVGMRIPHTVS